MGDQILHGVLVLDPLQGARRIAQPMTLLPTSVTDHIPGALPCHVAHSLTVVACALPKLFFMKKPGTKDTKLDVSGQWLLWDFDKHKASPCFKSAQASVCVFGKLQENVGDHLNSQLFQGIFDVFFLLCRGKSAIISLIVGFSCPFECHWINVMDCHCLASHFNTGNEQV